MFKILPTLGTLRHDARVIGTAAAKYESGPRHVLTSRIPVVLNFSSAAADESARRPIGIWSGVCTLVVAACPIAHAADGSPPAPPAPMEAVVVTARKLEVETLIDRKVYTVTSDVQSTFGTLSDILSVIPSIDVDPDGVVSLRGDTNVLILIDGKPSTQFSGSAAGDNLQSIPAKDIERIEVLTTPPAQFKADGAAGVINIITRKNRPEGESGSMQASHGSGGRSVLGIDGSYKSGPLALSATAGYRQDYRHRFTQSDLVAPDSTTGQLIDNHSSIDERIHREVPTLRLSGRVRIERSAVPHRLGEAGRIAVVAHIQGTERWHPAERRHRQFLATVELRARPGDRSWTRSWDSRRNSRSPGETLDLSLHRSTSHQYEHYDYVNDSFIPLAPTFVQQV